MNGSPPVIDDRIEPLIKAPSIDADKLYASLLTCYPQKSKWAIDVELRGALSSDVVISDGNTDLGRNYVQIVASMPLYSAKEMDRAMKNEHDRRTETAKGVASFVATIADRNHAMRELALYESLESRAAVRVRAGVISATEQVGYLEKVAKAQKGVIKKNAAIMADRLALMALCSHDKAETMNAYLKKVAALPKGDE